MKFCQLLGFRYFKILFLMKKKFLPLLILVFFLLFFTSSVSILAQETTKKVPVQTGTILDIPGADPKIYRQIDDVQKKSFSFLNNLLNYITERFWAIWDWFIEFLSFKKS